MFVNGEHENLITDTPVRVLTFQYMSRERESKTQKEVRKC